jgi:hypothetical protein
MENFIKTPAGSWHYVVGRPQYDESGPNGTPLSNDMWLIS